MSTPTIQRVLIKTHHMTSPKKILTLTHAASRLSCSVLLKTGRPPGIMLAEGEGALEWLDVVKRLRYKDFQLMRKEPVTERRMPALGAEVGRVVRLEEIKAFGGWVEGDAVLFEWWRVGMGYKKED